MRNFKETFPRLLIVYEHFAGGKLYDDYSWYPKLFINVGQPVTIITNKNPYYDTYAFLFGEITYLFTEWYK